MSFFDDGDDAIEEEPVRRARSSREGRPRSGSGSGSGSARTGAPRSGSPRRAPTQDAAIERRRIGAVAVLIVAVILVILLISSCQARNTKNSLENYSNNVSRLINRSDATSKAVFTALTSGGPGSTIANDLAQPVQSAGQELTDVRDLSVPGQMAAAQAKVLFAFQMRYDGIYEIAHHVAGISHAGAGATQAVAVIADAMSRFYASDVAYKDYATEEISGALHGDNIPVGTDNGDIIINGGQFLPDLGWLDTQFIDTELDVASSSGASSGSTLGQNTDTPGLHGEALDGVSVGSTTLQPSGTTVVPGTPAPTFTISVTDAGDFNQFGVTCTVSVAGGPSGKSSIAKLTPSTTEPCDVKFSSPVATGTYLVTVTIGKVPGEVNLANNTATYSVDFQ